MNKNLSTIQAIQNSRGKKKKSILNLTPAFMRPTLIRLYGLYHFVKTLPQNLYLRFNPLPEETKRDHDSIMRYLDHWVFRHSVKGYVPENFADPGWRSVAAEFGIQQVRKEISEFVRMLLLKGFGDSILEVGLGYNGGTHALWRQIFKRVITIEYDPWAVRRFKLKERLDSRSILIAGDSHDPYTLEKVRRYAECVDVLFIDGDHKYESVARDWAMYHNLVKPEGGIIAFHDTICTSPHYGIAKFLEDLSKGMLDGKHHILHSIVYSDQVGISYEEVKNE